MPHGSRFWAAALTADQRSHGDEVVIKVQVKLHSVQRAKSTQGIELGQVERREKKYLIAFSALTRNVSGMELKLNAVSDRSRRAGAGSHQAERGNSEDRGQVQDSETFQCAFLR